MVFISFYILLMRHIKVDHGFNSSNTSVLAPQYSPASATRFLVLKGNGHVNSSLYSETLENLCHMVRVQQVRVKIHMFWSSDPIFD